jgi:hypothetical protein
MDGCGTVFERVKIWGVFSMSKSEVLISDLFITRYQVIRISWKVLLPFAESTWNITPQ